MIQAIGALTRASVKRTPLNHPPLKRISLASCFSAVSHRHALRTLLIVVLVFAVLKVADLQADTRIDINTATASVLANNLPGIGPAKAKAIIEYRALHGPFSSLESLVSVKGIGPATLEKIRHALVIAMGPPLPTAKPSDTKSEATLNRKAPGSTKLSDQSEHGEGVSAAQAQRDTAETITTRAVRAIVDKARLHKRP